MTIALSQGTSIAIAETYGSVYNVTALTNAAEAVATVQAGHGLTPGDIIELTSGWDRLNGRVMRVKTVVTNDVTLESIDTQSTANYPAGAGVGSLRKVTAWQTVTQILNVSANAPTIDFVDVTTLADQTRKRIPGLDTPPDMTYTVLYDLTLAWVTAALKASDTNALIGLRMTLASGAKIYSNGYLKMSRFPQLSSGQAIQGTVSYSFNSTPVNYAS
jgi:hypothetical protein